MCKRKKKYLPMHKVHAKYNIEWEATEDLIVKPKFRTNDKKP